jgi:hypothetical protein
MDYVVSNENNFRLSKSEIMNASSDEVDRFSRLSFGKFK